jgi:hypothetical protein
MRWIVFDDETAEAVVSRWRRGGAEIMRDHPVDAALKAGGSSVMVLPSRVPGQTLVARFIVKTETQIPVATSSLSAVVDAVEISARKPWWRKFVA